MKSQKKKSSAVKSTSKVKSKSLKTHSAQRPSATSHSGDKLKRSDLQSEITLNIGKEIWPLERDILFRPDRLKYVRRLIKTDGCVFCQARDMKMDFNSLCVYQSEYSMIVLNKFPYNPGHVLVLPREHCGDLLKLTPDQYSDFFLTVGLAHRALREVYKPGGINLGMNEGAVAGAGIPEHLHFHLIPRWSGDLNFFPLIAETKTVVESLDMTFERLSTYFRNLAV